MECRKCPYYDNGLGGQYCGKTGGKTLVYGYCTDAYSSDVIKQINCSKQKRRNKRARDLKYRKHLKYLAENISGCPSPVIHIDEVWIRGQGYIKNPKSYYMRSYRGKHSKYLKKMSNKKIRRFNGMFAKKGNQSHRLFDFWWELS